MKLAEALNKRKDLIGLLSTLKNAASQEAYSKTSKSDEMVQKMTSIYREICALDYSINNANNTLTVKVLGKEYTLANARYTRDRCKDMSALFSELYRASPYIRTEAPVLHMDKNKVFALQNEFAKQARDLDTAIQGVNWTVDI